MGQSWVKHLSILLLTPAPDYRWTWDRPRPRKKPSVQQPRGASSSTRFTPCAEREQGSNCCPIHQRDFKLQHHPLWLELIRTLTFPRLSAKWMLRKTGICTRWVNTGCHTPAPNTPGPLILPPTDTPTGTHSLGHADTGQGVLGKAGIRFKSDNQ